MIIVMQPSATKENINRVVKKIRDFGYKTHKIVGVERTVIAAVGDERGKARLQSLESLPGVESVMPILKPYKLASREFKSENTIIKVGNVKIGGKKVVVIAGPCSVESYGQMLSAAKAAKKAGASLLRGGAFKPRTSPYSFQGLEEEGLKILAKVREKTGLPFVTEIMDTTDVDMVAEYSDMLQVGARNVQNFALLKKLGKIKKPILLKRGMMTTMTEFLMSAEYILSEGNGRVVLCERGIRTFETETRNTLDLSCIPVMKSKSHLPIIVDPSHGVGLVEYVPPMAKAAIAAGADGLLIEMHPKPEEAFSDGQQSLNPNAFSELMKGLKPFIKAAGRTF
ncbi:MAG: 3-deoxy-7-phosphoheptulonate synthase [Candidatus Schekmanbacteria bacterium]|nr:MAG: 3-deoxy-7-phosphoheptulonate synthase [Candidatus Schekmanbacteria bacterium]